MDDKKLIKDTGIKSNMSNGFTQQNSQLMSCLVQSRPRSTKQNRPQQTRVQSGKPSSSQKTIMSSQFTTSSTTTLKVSQFSSISESQQIKAPKPLNESQKFYTIQKNDQENTPQDDYQLYQSQQQQDTLSNQQLRQSLKSEDIVKSSSTSNVLKASNRSISKQISVVRSSKVLKKTVNLGVQEIKSRTVTPKRDLKRKESKIQEKEKEKEKEKEYVVPQTPAQQFSQTPQHLSQTSPTPTPQLTKSEHEINQKFDIVLNKYKNSSFFSQDVPTTLFKKAEIVAPQTQSASIVNKYVTRVSRGKTLMGQVFSQKKDITVPRKRMNSPLHSRQQPQQESSLFSSRDGLSPSKNISLKKQFSSADKFNRNKKKQGSSSFQFSSVNNPLFTKPFNEFGYHMSFLQYFHQSVVQFKNVAIPPKISKLYNNNKETINYFDGIYKEHFLQTYHALQFCRDIEKMTLDQIQSKVVQLPPNKFKRTLIFDLDETLIHCNESNESPADVTLPILFPSGETIDAGINVRPFCREMLSTLSTQFEVIVFTASHECYASKVLDYLDPDGKLIHHRFFRDSCVIVDDGLHIKDLRVMGNRDLKDMLIVDNAAYSYYFQMENGIPIAPFYDNQQDKELIYLTAYLLAVTQQTDMLQHNMSYFKHNKFLEENTPEQTLTRMF